MMTTDNSDQIVDKAKEMGAALVGIASMECLKKSPSHEILRKYGTKVDGVYSFSKVQDLNEIEWPEKANSALVIAISHPQDKPELDWSDASGNTPGNRLLQRINQELSAWIEEKLGVKTQKMPYWVEEGGIYLKDTAVLGGLGCIGKNNILITPDFGPRVRFRAMLLEAELRPTGPINFDPCHNCEEFCRSACPELAFDTIVHSSDEMGISALPGRDGFYSRARCSIRLENDVQETGIPVDDDFLSEKHQTNVETGLVSKTRENIKWCRLCELACPVGI